MTMTTASFARPVPLPCYVDDARKTDIWADGYIFHEQSYDGWQNKVRITPLVKSPEGISPTIPVGQDYTIGVTHLTRLILIENAKYHERNLPAHAGQ